MNIRMVSGRNIAHGKRDATRAAFLGADIQAGIVGVKDFTDVQITQLVGSSLPYHRAAAKVAAHPLLRKGVEERNIALMDAAKKLRPQPKPPQPAPDVFEQFMGASVEVRAQCMRAVIDEAIALLDETTSPDIGPVMSDGNLFVPHHL